MAKSKRLSDNFQNDAIDAGSYETVRRIRSYQFKNISLFSQSGSDAVPIEPMKQLLPLEPKSFKIPRVRSEKIKREASPNKPFANRTYYFPVALPPNDLDEGIQAETFIDPLTVIPSEKIEFVTEEDSRVCPECQAEDGNEYDFDDEDKPLPPLHPNCRCYYVYTGTGDKVHFSGSEWEGY